MIVGTRDGKTTKRMLVTPELAKEWLAKSEEGWQKLEAMLGRKVENRSIKIPQLEQMVRRYRDGTFPADLTLPVRIHSYGAVLDAQHRLTAQVISGVSMWCDVEFDAPYEDMANYDGGVARTTADALKIRGTANPKERQALANQILRQTLNKIIKVSTDDVDYLERESPFAEGFAFAMAGYAAYNKVAGKRLNIAPFWGAIAVAYATFDPDVLSAFVDGVMTGANLSPGSPALALRNALVQKEGTDGTASMDKFRRVYTALRAEMQNRTLRTCPQVGPSAQQYFLKQIQDDVNVIKKRYATSATAGTKSQRNIIATVKKDQDSNPTLPFFPNHARQPFVTVRKKR
jgi:hypothetical protein